MSKRSGATCATGGLTDEDAYNTPFHVGALFIILFISSTACAFPMLAMRFPGMRLPDTFFFAIRHFGTGVLIATAFVHLMPTAFIMLGDPCLGSFWTEDYPAMPGAISLAGIFFVAVIEMIFHPSRHIPVRSPSSTSLPEEVGNINAPEQAASSVVRSASVAHGPSPFATEKSETTTTAAATTPGNKSAPASPVIGPLSGNVDKRLPLRPMGSRHGSSSSIGRRLSLIGRRGPNGEPLDRRPSMLGKQALEFSSEEPLPDSAMAAAATRGNNDMTDAETGSMEPGALTPELKRRKELLQCVLLECGILFHSIFIGMALRVSIGGEFVVLLIAIAFHRKFSPFRPRFDPAVTNTD